MKRVSVIIPNWNGKELLEPCLETLYRQQFDDFETILVYNGSIMPGYLNGKVYITNGQDGKPNYPIAKNTWVGTLVNF